jgi:hypothetical protein
MNIEKPEQCPANTAEFSFCEVQIFSFVACIE